MSASGYDSPTRAVVPRVILLEYAARPGHGGEGPIAGGDDAGLPSRVLAPNLRRPGDTVGRVRRRGGDLRRFVLSRRPARQRHPGPLLHLAGVPLDSKRRHPLWSDADDGTRGPGLRGP